MGNKQDRIWRERTVAEFEILPGCYSGGDVEDHNTFWQNSLFESQDLTAGPSQYEARILISQQQLSTHLLLKEALEHNKHHISYPFEDSGLNLLGYCHL